MGKLRRSLFKKLQRASESLIHRLGTRVNSPRYLTPLVP